MVLKLADESLWKMYEGITHLATKTAQWDKYDCAQKSFDVGFLAALGFGLYGSLQAVCLNQSVLIPLYFATPALAYISKKRKKEKKNLFNSQNK